MLAGASAMTRSLHTAEQATLVRVLVDARKELELTQQEVADRLGKPQSYLAKIEGGERRLDVLEFIALARALGRDPRELFTRILDAL